MVIRIRENKGKQKMKDPSLISLFSIITNYTIMPTFNCTCKNLTSLQDANIPEGTTKLYCYNNQLTSLEHCPSSLTYLHCWDNQLTSLEHCPSSVTILACWNKLTSLEHCPSSVTTLDCGYNQLTSFRNEQKYTWNSIWYYSEGRFETYSRQTRNKLRRRIIFLFIYSSP